MLQKVNELHETNPMLGLRGRAPRHREARPVRDAGPRDLRGRGAVKKEGGDPKVEIMIPLVATAPELRQMRDELEPIADEVLASAGVELDHLEWGTMIELPRAAVTGRRDRRGADFFSFGTNDLTQTAFGFSRDDIGKFVGMYEERKLVPANPFVTIDRSGRRTADVDRRRGGQGREPGAAPGDLRRARRRPGERGLLPPDRPGLRELLAVPRGDRAARRRPGCDRRRSPASK